MGIFRTCRNWQMVFAVVKHLDEGTNPEKLFR
jgi:hypothetical protein